MCSVLNYQVGSLFPASELYTLSVFGVSQFGRVVSTLSCLPLVYKYFGVSSLFVA